MLPVSGITPFGGAAIQLARVLAPFAGQALHALASRSVMHSASPSTAAAAIPQTVAHRPASEWFVVRSEERVEVPATPHEEEPIFEVHHSSQRFANTLSTYRQAISVGAATLLGFGLGFFEPARRPGNSRYPRLAIGFSGASRLQVYLPRVGVDQGAQPVSQPVQAAAYRH